MSPRDPNNGLMILVCGGRHYANAKEVNAQLDDVRSVGGPLTIVQGGGTGADALARAWAKATGSRCITVTAEWRKFGKAAGPMRNQAMLDSCNPDMVIAFPGGRGTADMLRRAKKAGIETFQIKWDLEEQEV